MAVRFEDTELSTSALKLVLKEINESEETRSRCLKEIKKELSDIEDLNPCLDDQFLLKFLRISKFDSSKAITKILKYYQHHKANPSIYEEFLPSTILKAELTRNLWALPYRAKDNSIIVIWQRRLCDSSIATFDEIFRMQLLIFQTAILNPVTQMCGATIIADLKVSANLNEYTPSRLRFIADILKNGACFRIKAIHIVNIPAIFYILYRIAYHFLPTKIKSRMILHSKYDNWKSLHSYISPDILTQEFGGSLKQSDVINLVDLMREKEEYFRKQLQYGFKDKMK